MQSGEFGDDATYGKGQYDAAKPSDSRGCLAALLHHVMCRYERGRVLRTGTVLYVEERLHGHLHRLRLCATEVVPGKLVRYQGKGFAGAFVVAPEGEGTRFTAELSFGTSAPIVGRVLDAIAGFALRSRLEAFRTHMREEGENLKRLLEQG